MSFSINSKTYEIFYRKSMWSTLWFQFVFQTSSMRFETPYHVEKEIQFLVTKRGWTWKRISFLKSLNVNFLAMLWFSITWNQFWRIQREKQWKYIFLWYFMKKIRKTRKYRFWLQKVVKIWIWQYFIDGQSSNCVSLHFSIIFGQIFFVIRSHGFDGLFAAFDVAWGILVWFFQSKIPTENSLYGF